MKLSIYNFIREIEGNYDLYIINSNKLISEQIISISLNIYNDLKNVIEYKENFNEYYNEVIDLILKIKYREIPISKIFNEYTFIIMEKIKIFDTDIDLDKYQKNYTNLKEEEDSFIEISFDDCDDYDNEIKSVEEIVLWK